MSAYRYENLGAVIAKLADLREEIQRIRAWDMNVSREATSEKIDKGLSNAKALQAKAARQTVNTRLKNILKLRIMCAVGLVIGAGMVVGAYFAEGEEGLRFIGGSIGLIISMLCSAGLLDPSGWSNHMGQPSSWDDMKELAEDAD